MTLSRRRFLTIASAACLAAPAAHAYRWQGVALGARTQIILDHPRAAEIAEAAAAEIDRLEDLFSLYRPTSELRRLNAAGTVAAPSFEMLDCLSVARRVFRTTEGRFDPTVQPLWQVLAEARMRGMAPKAGAVLHAREAIGFDRVTFDSAGIRLGQGQALTLNGIAQGYIADRVARLMRRQGVDDVLIDTGELVALGGPGGGPGWPVTIAGEIAPLALSGRALATSAPLAMVLDAGGRSGHILDPRLGTATKPSVKQVSVSASRASLADALATALCLVRDADEARRLLSQHKDAGLESLQLAA